MKWRRVKSDKVIDRRGARPARRSPFPTSRRAGGAGGSLPIPGGVGGAGAGGLILIVVLVLLSGVCSGGSGGGMGDLLQGLQPAPASAPDEAPLEGHDPDRDLVDFMTFVLEDVQGMWTQVFSGSEPGYREAELVIFSDATQSGCGFASAEVGPHYCPLDERIYIDLDFMRELQRRLDAGGDFAQAYILAHEVAHHVQNVTGVMGQVRELQQANPADANELSILLELQADCLAGVWAHTTYERDLLEQGDLQEALDAAAAVGDDRIQRQAGGTVNPETWTHGSSEQRVFWFQRGFETGDPRQCDTFSS